MVISYEETICKIFIDSGQMSARLTSTALKKDESAKPRLASALSPAKSCLQCRSALGQAGLENSSQ